MDKKVSSHNQIRYDYSTCGTYIKLIQYYS